MTRTRFAPSPTGFLHVGNLRPALFNWLYARKMGGSFVLRLDDTDKVRSQERFCEAIMTDLSWLGIDPDQVERQSERFARYDALFERLVEAGRIYPCFESAEALERHRRRARARGLPPVYDRAALALSDAQKQSFLAEGRRPYWRFRLSDRVITMDDRIRGPVAIDTRTLSDPVVRREDGTWLYILTSVIDDVDLAIDTVIRGEDHVTNTVAQIDMFDALGAKVPTFAHHNLLVASQGEAFSKRRGDLALRGLREAGIEPEALRAYCALIGTSDPVSAVFDPDALAAGFDFAKISRAPAAFDLDELASLSRRALHRLRFSDAAKRFKSDKGASGARAVFDEKVWTVARPNLERFADIYTFMDILDPDFRPPADRLTDLPKALITAGLDLLPATLNAQTARSWLRLVGKQSGLQGGSMFKPLRRLLSGADSGPALPELIALLGVESVRDRLTHGQKIADLASHKGKSA